MLLNKRIFQGVLALLLVFNCCSQILRAQDRVIVKPEINYASSPANYIIGGITLDGVTEYDQSILLNISGLRVGQTITIPQSDNAVSVTGNKACFQM